MNHIIAMKESNPTNDLSKIKGSKVLLEIIPLSNLFK